MFRPSGSTPIAVTSAPRLRNASGAMLAIAPFAQSSPIVKPDRSEPKPTIAAT